MSDKRAEKIAYLETLGEQQVRLFLSNNRFSSDWTGIVVQWLAEKDREAELTSAALEREQIEIARSASAAAIRAADAAEVASNAAVRQAVAAERANTRATIALAIAIIAITVSAIGILLPYWSVHK